MNTHMFNLLIEKGMDNFTVAEARDELMQLTTCFQHKDKARMFVYRQVHTFEKLGWLRSTGSGRTKRFHKTESCNSLKVVSKDNKYAHCVMQLSEPNVLSSLLDKKQRYTDDLAINLSEINEYHTLLDQLPVSQRQDLAPLVTLAKNESTKLFGKINAINSVISACFPNHINNDSV